jgi:hypothetical protein
MWLDLANALNSRFAMDCSRELSSSNLQYLAEKLFGKMDDYSRMLVTWSQFNRVSFILCVQLFSIEYIGFIQLFRSIYLDAISHFGTGSTQYSN